MINFFLYLIVVLNIFLLGFEFISFRLNGDGINESIFYHISNPVEGAAVGEFKLEILFSIFIVIFILAICFFLYKLNLSKKQKY